MKKTPGMKAVSFLLIALFMMGCSKYEEGSASLASKKSRLCNDWVVVQITADGIDITSLNIITEVIIRNDNSITVKGAPFGIPTSSDGKWAFNAGKTHVLVTNNNGSVNSYEIIKLEKDSFKVRYLNTDGVTELHEYKSN